jgi:hypothetical protein
VKVLRHYINEGFDEIDQAITLGTRKPNRCPLSAWIGTAVMEAFVFAVPKAIATGRRRCVILVLTTGNYLLLLVAITFLILWTASTADIESSKASNGTNKSLHSPKFPVVTRISGKVVSHS